MVDIGVLWIRLYSRAIISGEAGSGTVVKIGLLAGELEVILSNEQGGDDV